MSDPASQFVLARRSGRALDAYPGELPTDLDEGYRCQDRAIALWQEPVVGWKVGLVPPDRRDGSGDERLLGPIFASALWPDAKEREVEFPVFSGGFAAVEAEYVFRLCADAPASRTDWTPADAAAMVDALHIGVELAGSPLATINDLGPAVVVSDFGNNAGLILGQAVDGWRERMDDLHCATWIDGVRVGRGGAHALPGGPLAALAFALSRSARRGRALRAGDLVTTGAATGIHDVVAGQRARVVFDGLGEIRCRAVARAVTAA